MVAVAWRPAAVPLPPEAVVARGDAARRLAQRVLNDAAVRESLRGVCAPGVLVLLGRAEHLPFVDGVTYVGRPFAEAGVLWPTALEPSVDARLVERAAVLRAARVAAPWVWVPVGEPLWCSVARAEKVGPAALAAFVEAEAARGTSA